MSSRARTEDERPLPGLADGGSPGLAIETPASAPPPGTPAEVTVGAAEVRIALELTPHQLSEFTAGLHVDVGDRPNYPRFRQGDVHRMTAVQALRELRIPLDVALRAGCDYATQIVASTGWLVLVPSGDGWSMGLTTSTQDLLAWLRAGGGRGSVLDLGSVAGRARADWERALG